MCTAAVEDDCLISYSISWSTQAIYRNCKAESIGGLQIDDELVFGRLRHLQLGDSCSIACADAGGLYYRTPLVDFRLKQRSEPFRRRAFDNNAE